MSLGKLFQRTGDNTQKALHPGYPPLMFPINRLIGRSGPSNTQDNGEHKTVKLRWGIRKGSWGATKEELEEGLVW